MHTNKHEPPKWATKILEWTTDRDVRYPVLGDFAEMFSYRLEDDGFYAARRWYWAQALKSVPSFLVDTIYWKLVMILNYLKVAMRNLARQKAFSAINLIGLSVGTASFLLIALFVTDELSYDNFHKNADQIYRVSQLYTNSPGTAPLEDFQPWGSAKIGPALVAEFSEVAEQVRFSGRHQIMVSKDDIVFQEEKYLYVDPNVFNVFSFDLLRGNPETALVEPGSIVLTESAATKYFQDYDPMGQSLSIGSGIPAVVTGIMKDVPTNSHLEFNMLISIATIEQVWSDYTFNSWGYVDFFTYIRLQDEANIEDLVARMPRFFQGPNAPQPDENGSNYEFRFENLREAYLSPTGNFQAGPKGSPSNLMILSIIALFILLIACVNYVNLATARSSERAKEIGIRKAVGAHQQSLISQFLTESTIFAGIAIVSAFALAILFLPAFDDLTGKSFSGLDLLRPATLGFAAAIVLIIGLVAGSYPALILSKFQPSTVLKGTFSRSKSGTFLRKSLVVFQFGITFSLIAGAITVYSQLEFMQNRSLGFDKEQMMSIDFGFDDSVLSRSAEVREAFMSHPAVSSAALSRTVPGEYFPQAGGEVESSNGSMITLDVNIFQVDYDYIEHFDIEMAAGRAYSREIETDLQEALVLNEAAVKDLGYASNEEAIGKRFSQWGRAGHIIGVVKDFNYQSLQVPISPLSLSLDPNSSKFISVKLNTTDLSQTVDELANMFAEFAPHRPFLYRFLDETFDAQYRSETQFGLIMRIFSFLAILIACLGLLGLTASVTAQRKKEIGVRKVLGASSTSILTLLSKDFALLVLLAALMATPMVYFALNLWLNEFAFRISASPWTFIQAGLLALVVAMITVNFHSLKAANSNPVDSLRSE